jgi:LysM repeat protein
LFCCILLLVLSLATASCGQVVTRVTATPSPRANATATETLALPTLARPTRTPAPYTPPPTATPTATPEPVIYRIEQGENLYIIAAKFGVSHDLLRDVNGIEDERALQVGQELIIPLGGQTEPIEPTPTFTPTPMPAKVQNIYFHPSPLGELAVLGEVLNTSGTDLERVSVQVSLYDGGDRLLASQSAFVALDAIAPGENAPFALRFAEAPERFASYQAEILSAVPAYLGSLHRDLEARGVTAEKRPREPMVLNGRIWNYGTEEAVAVIVVVTTYDPLGRVVGVRSVVPEHNVVPKGGETVFHVELVPAGPVITYTIQAQGRQLELQGPGAVEQ